MKNSNGDFDDYIDSLIKDILEEDLNNETEEIRNEFDTAGEPVYSEKYK